jgi:adenylate kinase
MHRPVAITGTPGTGKSTVARQIAGPLRVVELSTLARTVGAAEGRGRNVQVDLRRLARIVEEERTLDAYDVIVGHLSHLLPVSEAIVLRCHPAELLRRLRRARRGSAAERQENVVCEATDLVLAEALATGRPVYEVDTTGRTSASVVAVVRRRIRTGGPARWGTVDWLGDPRVTAHLLDRPR